MPEIRNAVIREIVYQKEGSDWAVVKTTDKKNPKWVGNIATNLTPGTYIEAEGEVGPQKGRWAPDFLISRVLQVYTDVGKAWMIWRLPEIGEARAEALSEKYGRRLPQMLGNRAEATAALSAIRGLTPAYIREIISTFANLPDELELALWLGEPDPDNAHGQGLPWGAIKTTIKEYNKTGGPPAVRLAVEEDPFDLMALDGITFDMADMLATGLGLDARDPRRMRGMVWEALDKLAFQGDCYQSRERVVSGLGEKFGFTERELNKILNEGKHFKFLRSGAQLNTIARAEQTVATRAQMMLAEPSQLHLDLDDIPLKSAKDFKLDTSQREAIFRLLQSPLCILTGGPGTGKTTVLDTALRILDSHARRIVLASPTGKAAKRMTETTGRPASTVHRMLGFRPEGFQRDASNPIDADVIVVDEASMLDINLAAALFAAIREGTQLVLVGDVNQLPPVGPGLPLLDLMNSKNVPVYALTEVHRQGKDSWVIDNAQRILEGKLPSLTAQSDFYFADAGAGSRGSDRGSEEITDKIISVVINTYRKTKELGPEAEKQLQVLTPETKRGASTRVLNHEIQKAMNPLATDPSAAEDYVNGASDNRIWAGDKVFYMKNKPELGLVNGSMGTVLAIEVEPGRRSVTATVQFEGETNPETSDDVFELRDSETTPLDLAYAMTIHKAQGSEWSHVVVVADPGHWQKRKLLYTAITRTNKNLMIVGTEAAVAAAVRDTSAEKGRATLLQQRLRGEQV